MSSTNSLPSADVPSADVPSADVPYGDFSFIQPSYMVPMLKNAFDAITTEELWDWIKTESPPENKGYMFWEHPNISRISSHMDSIGHSGASFGSTMRTMELIAKNGWDAFVNTFPRKPTFTQ